MQFCKNHWNKLRKGIEDEGFSYAIARGKKAAAENLASELKGKSRRETFDPLMAAHNMILGNAMNVAGLEVLGNVCPQCFLIEHCGCEKKEECDYEKWTHYAISNAIAEAKKIGMASIK